MNPSDFFSEIELKKIRSSCFMIVGGAGYIGSHVAQLLIASGAKLVKVVDDLRAENTMRRIQPLMEAKAFDFVKISTKDHHIIEEIVENDGIDLILYLANDTHVGSSINDPTLIIDEFTNFVNMLNIAKAWSSKFVYGSSSLVYGENYDGDHLLTESDKCNPMTPYAAMKLACESIAKSYSQLYDFPTLGLRYFEIYGPDQKFIEQPGDLPYDMPLISSYILPLASGQDIHVDSTKNDIITPCNIQDCAIITIKSLLNDDSNDNILNVAGSDNISKIDLVQLITKIIESKSNIVEHNKNFIDDVIDWHDDGDSEQDDGNVIDFNCADLSNMIKYTNYKPETPLANGLIETAKHNIKVMLYMKQAKDAINEAITSKDNN